jgi:hypothetical protein
LATQDWLAVNATTRKRRAASEETRRKSVEESTETTKVPSRGCEQAPRKSQKGEINRSDQPKEFISAKGEEKAQSYMKKNKEENHKNKLKAKEKKKKLDREFSSPLGVEKGEWNTNQRAKEEARRAHGKMDAAG